MAQPIERSHLSLLAQVSHFARLDRVALAKLAGFVESVSVAQGEVVCRQGDTGDALYVIAQGRFDVSIASVDSERHTHLNSLQSGDFFGEMALLTGELRSATVTCEGEGTVLRLEKARFLELVRRDPEIALAVAGTLGERLQSADRAVAAGGQVIAESISGTLDRITPERRTWVLAASFLDEPSPQALRALFGNQAEGGTGGPSRPRSAGRARTGAGPADPPRSLSEGEPARGRATPRSGWRSTAVEGRLLGASVGAARPVRAAGDVCYHARSGAA